MALTCGLLRPQLQQELQAMKQQQELAEKERRLEQQQNQQEKEQERLRREQHVSSLSLRGKERPRESKSSLSPLLPFTSSENRAPRSSTGCEEGAEGAQVHRFPWQQP